MKKLCAFLIFLASYGGLLAQYHATVTYSTRDGMLSSELSSVFVDSKGYVWTSSASGLSRFDGQSFRNFTVETAWRSTTFIPSGKTHKGGFGAIMENRHSILFQRN
ncbi:MAG: hypothetical protein IPJ00_19495 [Saprospirales bacterium]|nr:hypothetical protein [Saprospirales bacterium]